MLVVEEDWEGGGCDEGKILQLMDEAAGMHNIFPQLFTLGLSADRSEGTPS